MADTTINNAEETIVEQQPTNEQTATQTADQTTTNVDVTATATETPTETSTENVIAKTEVIATTDATKKTFEELAKEHGFDAELELLKQARANKEKELAEQEKPFEDTKAFAEKVEFASKNKLAVQDDFIQHIELNKEKDEVLAFNKFKSEFIPDEDEELLNEFELAEVIKEKFNDKYDLESENEKLKKAGLKEIAEIANEIRKPINDKINSVNERMLVSAMSQQHQSAIAEFNKNAKNLTTTIKDAEGNEVEIVAEITPTIDAKEIQAFLSSDEGTPVFDILFTAFSQSREAGDKAFGDFLNTQYAQKNKAVEAQKIAENAYNLGLAKGKEMGVGAKAPFNSKENSINLNNNNGEPLREYSGGKFV